MTPLTISLGYPNPPLSPEGHHRPNHLLPNPVKIPVAFRTQSTIVLDFLNAPPSSNGAPINPHHPLSNTVLIPVPSRTPQQSSWTIPTPLPAQSGHHQPTPPPTQTDINTGTVQDPLNHRDGLSQPATSPMETSTYPSHPLSNPV